MGAADETTYRPSDSGVGEAAQGTPIPGLVLVYAAGQPAISFLPLGTAETELGRQSPLFASREDTMMSRQHARAAYRQGRFEITDLDSRNGSALDGQAFVGHMICDTQRVLRLGNSLFLLCDDLRPFCAHGVKVRDRRIEGPALQQTLRSVVHFAEHSRTLFIMGESGAGKESLAEAFHRAGPQQRGPFVAVNCATIPEGLAERLLFGAQKGAYSGAAGDSTGYLQAASGGTLFLDEVAELDTTVQAKFLRTLESQEVLPLGATRSQKIDIRICCATHKDLRSLTSTGAFRADLYFRLGMPQVVVPPLRERLEEIPWYIKQAVEKVSEELATSAELVEACMLRAWPGNIRELLAELNSAAVKALSTGARAVKSRHLGEHAGASFSKSAAGPEPFFAALPGTASKTIPAGSASSADEVSEARGAAPSRAKLMEALFEHKGNLSATARSLGLHRTQLRRYLEEHGIDLIRVRNLHKG